VTGAGNLPLAPCIVLQSELLHLVNSVAATLPSNVQMVSSKKDHRLTIKSPIAENNLCPFVTIHSGRFRKQNVLLWCPVRVDSTVCPASVLVQRPFDNATLASFCRSQLFLALLVNIPVPVNSTLLIVHFD
jgi:hypothetical protein